MIPINSQMVYWEKQGSDKLCGVHCINTLLQGPFYNEIVLSEIALELDKTEKNLMAEHGVDTTDYLKFMVQDSNNVADDGNYSIQVLSDALSKQFSLILESIDAKLNKNEDLSNEQGFICNSSSHWFSIRRINSIWLNLNSTNKQGPEIVSDFYLSAFLHSIKENGYSIFVVKGDYPYTDKSLWPDLNKNQLWFTMEQIKKTHDNNMKSKNYKLNIGGTDERDLEQAIKNSLQDYENQQPKNKEENLNENENKQEEPKFISFGGKGVSLNNNSSFTLKNIQGYEKYLIEMENDPELWFVFIDSLSSKFEVSVPQNGIQMNFKFPNGKTKTRIFGFNSTVEDIYDFAKYCIVNEGENYEFYLSSNYPTKIYLNLYETFVQAEIFENKSINVNRIAK